MDIMVYMKLCLVVALSLVAESLQDDPIVDLWVLADRGCDDLADET
jgi:hypothetical protein